MAETNNKKKLATSAVALTTAAALLLGGTLAWQSISQEALNVAADDVNPGGRLHDDFNGSNKDVYVENFADEQIFARVRLDEYFEYGQDAGKNFDADSRSVVKVTENAEWNNKSTWTTHLFDGTDVTEDYWTWETGGSTVYMPTFNMNKDSLEADINGTFEGDDGTDGVTDGDTADRYSDYDTYEVGDTEEGTEIYDADTNADDEVAEGTAVLGVNYTENVTIHTAQSTLGATLISMQEWIDDGMNEGPYWVYDTDGWVYWAQAIEPDTATGLLLDGISLTGVVDDNWYYGINVVGQFITANDLGADNGTGFYDSNAGTEPSADALALLEAIGVKTSDGDGEGEYGSSDVYFYVNDEPLDGVKAGETYNFTLKDESGNDVNATSLTLYDDDFNESTSSTISGNVLNVSATETTDRFYIQGVLEDGTSMEISLYVDYPYIEITYDEEIGDYLTPNSAVTLTANRLIDYSTNETWNLGDYTLDDITWTVETDENFAAGNNYTLMENADCTATLKHTCTSEEACSCAENISVWATHNENSNIRGYETFWLYKSNTVDTMHVAIDGEVYSNNEGGTPHELSVTKTEYDEFISIDVGEIASNGIKAEFVANDGTDMGTTYYDGGVCLDTTTQPTSFTMTLSYDQTISETLSADVKCIFNVTVNWETSVAN